MIRFAFPTDFATMRQPFACRWLAALLVISAGCGDKTPDYTPSAADAESALRQSLETWKDFWSEYKSA